MSIKRHQKLPDVAFFAAWSFGVVVVMSFPSPPAGGADTGRGAFKDPKITESSPLRRREPKGNKLKSIIN